MVAAMTESDRIASAEREIRAVLQSADGPVSSAELSERLQADTPRSLVRLAVQRMIGRGTITYDAERRYALPPVHQTQT
jgi:hypothetical protein